VDVQQTTAVSISAPQAAAIRLRVGAEVAARVVEPPGPDGRGLLSLAGAVVRARLPLGLHAGDRLRLHVVGRDGDQLVLRRVSEERPVSGLPASVLAELAESGDGEQLRAALALAGGPIPLPGGRVLTIEPDAEDEAAARDRPDEGSVRVVLHTPTLGALELRLGLHGGSLAVEVIADPAVAAAASGAAPELREAVLSSTGLASQVGVVERRGAAPLAPAVIPVDEVRRYG
jgi:hypothetical protein